MAAQKGKTFVLKIGDGATSEVFVTIGGMRTTAITINNTSVDITDKDSDSWTELLADAGGRNVTIRAGGVFKDTAAETSVLDAAMQALIDNYEVVFEDGSKFSGGFQIESLEYTGDNNDVRQYSFNLVSSGEITFTPAA